MEITKLIWCALCATVLSAFVLSGCEELELYSIDAPSDLQSKIDSIAAAKAGEDTGDTTYLTITKAIVGAEDYSSGWGTVFSDYFFVPTNKLLHLEFVNHTSGAANWNNWNLGLANGSDPDADDYAEYFILRADGWGLGNDFDFDYLAYEYPDTDGDGDIWNDFRTTMDGAYVTIEVDHATTGIAYITATAEGTNGVTLVETYQHPVSEVDDIVAFLVCDASYFEMKNAYLLPSNITVGEDAIPVAIDIAGTPEYVDLGDDNFWRHAVATVTYADGTSAEVDSADLSFAVLPDMTTLGEKTVSVSYSKTKQGEFTKAISTLYNLEVTTPLVSIALTTLPAVTTYYYYGDAPIALDITGMVVTATFSGGATAVLSNESLQVGTVSVTEGTQAIDITYIGSTTKEATYTITLVEGIAQVGANDFSSSWPTYSETSTIPSGESITLKMVCYSSNANNWNSPSLALGTAGNLNTDVAAADGADAVVRMDHFGWGDGYATASPTSDWNWDIFAASISGSLINITVTNHGDNTATVLYNVTYANGETHFQQYAGITIDSSDLTCALVTEGAYLIILD